MSKVIDLEPGDFILVRTNHFVSKLIRFGQRGYGEPYASYNHAALYVGDGQIVEALTTGVVLSRIDKYPTVDVQAVKSVYGSYPRERAHAVAFALSCVGQSYGWATIAAIALKVLFEGRWQFAVQGSSICSGLVARSLERFGYNFTPFDPAELTPAYLARNFAFKR